MENVLNSWVMGAYFLFLSSSHILMIAFLLLNFLFHLKAIAGEAGVPFFYRAGSEFEEM